MKIIKIFFYFTFITLTSTQIFPKDFNDIEESSAVFIVKGDIKASMHVSLKRVSEDTWQLNSSIKKFGITFRKESALFKINKEQLVPISWQRKGEALVQFDWKENKITFKEKKKTGYIDLQKGFLGPATAQLKLRLDIRNYDTSNLPDSINYQVYYKGEIKNRKYKIEGLKFIDTPLGKFEAIKVSRVRSRSEHRKQIFWLVPSLDYTIAQIVNDDGKRLVTIKLKELGS